MKPFVRMLLVSSLAREKENAATNNAKTGELE